MEGDDDAARQSLLGQQLSKVSMSRVQSTTDARRTSAREHVLAHSLKDCSLAHLNVDGISDLFQLIDTDGNGKITKDELTEVCNIIRDEAFINIINNLDNGNDDCYTEEQIHEALFGMKPPTFVSNLMFGVLIWVLPLIYSVNTRLPFICLALEITVTRGGDLWQVGVTLGVYQTCRSISNAVISAFGGSNPMARLHLPMLAIGFFAWLYMLLSTGGGVWNLLAFGGVGLTEVVVNLQTALIRETRLQSPSRVADPLVLSKRLRKQYAAIASGSCLSYIIGGALFTYQGFTAICYTGIACIVTQIIFSAIYLIEARTRTKLNCDEHIQLNEIDMKSIFYRLVALKIIAEESSNAFNDDEENIFAGDDTLITSSKYWRSDPSLQCALENLFNVYFETSAGMGGMIDASLELTAESSTSSSMELTIDKPGMEGMVGASMALVGKHCKRRRNSLMKNMAAFVCRTMDKDKNLDLSQEDFVDYLGPRVFEFIFGSEHEASVQVVWPYMKLIVATQAIMALCIGTFLSTALLLYTEKFDINASIVGILLGAGEGLGALTIFGPTLVHKFSKLSKPNDDSAGFFVTILSRPMHVITVLFVLSSATIGFTSRNFVVAVIFQFVMSGVNDLSVTLLNELIATSLPADQFRKMQGLGQWLRRLGNMLTGITGPIMFGVYRDLPFLVFGGTVFLWTVGLWHAIWTHANAMNADGGKNGPISAFSSSVLWHDRERNYYVANKDSLDKQLLGSVDHSTDIKGLEYSVRKLNAALFAEQAKRKAIEKKLEKLSQKLE